MKARRFFSTFKQSQKVCTKQIKSSKDAPRDTLSPSTLEKLEDIPYWLGVIGFIVLYSAKRRHEDRIDHLHEMQNTLSKEIRFCRLSANDGSENLSRIWALEERVRGLESQLEKDAQDQQLSALKNKY